MLPGLGAKGEDNFHPTSSHSAKEAWGMASTFPSFILFQAQDPLSARSQPLAWEAIVPGHSILEASAKAS